MNLRREICQSKRVYPTGHVMKISMFVLSDAYCEVIAYGYPNVLDYDLENEGVCIKIDA